MRRMGVAFLAWCLVFGVVGLASADQYTISGTFATTAYSGPLNGGSFSGTVTATLPVSGVEDLTDYTITLINPNGTILTDLTPASPGAFADVEGPEPCINASGLCEAWYFASFFDGFTQIELSVPPGFIGGTVTPSESYVVVGGDAADSVSLVGSGSIDPTAPEPGTLLLFGTGLVVLAGFVRKQLRLSRGH